MSANQLQYWPGIFFITILLLAGCSGGSGDDGDTSHTVSTNVGTGGSIAPTSATVDDNQTAHFTISPDSGFSISNVSGCSGSLSGNTYTTGAVTADCVVSATFNAVTTSSPPTAAAVPTLTFSAVKTFRFAWTDVGDATFYRLMENADGNSGFSQVGSDMAQGTQSYDHIVPLYARVNARYMLQSCNTHGCTDSTTVSVSGTLDSSIGYFKASNTESLDQFGWSVSLSGDGNTLAVGATIEASNATGVNGDQSNNDMSQSGAVYVFVRNGNSWDQDGYIKAHNTDANDLFGHAVSLSDDGLLLAVSARQEDSNESGVNGSNTGGNDPAGSDSGAVYIFNRLPALGWSQYAYIKASNNQGAGAFEEFGQSIQLSGDGNTLVVGAIGEDSDSLGVNGDQTNADAFNSGAVYVFSFDGSDWAQQAYLKASNTQPLYYFGYSLGLSTDGNTLAVGSLGEASAATGVNGAQTNDGVTDSGAVYVFTRSGTNWSQQAYIKASNTDSDDNFGEAIDLSGDGNTLAVGASQEDSAAEGIDGDQGTGFGVNGNNSGAVYVFSRNGSDWSQQAYIKVSNNTYFDRFGYSVALSDDGNILAAGAYSEQSSATGINGQQIDETTGLAGAAYLFSRNGATWSQQAYIKASNTNASDRFGWSISLDGAGTTLAVGAYTEGSDATGVAGDQDNNNAANSGAVYLY
jgi:hypothetical protein